MDDQQRPTIEDLLARIEHQEERHRRELSQLRQQIVHPQRSRYAFRRLMIPALSGLAALSMSGSAYASIPDSGGVIHGCYSTLGGERAFFLMDTAVMPVCPTGQTPISWNAHGPTGPTGATGPRGVTGTTGSTGATGPVVGYEAHNSTGTGLGIAPVIVAHTPSLPAGTYLVNSSATLGVNAGAAGACYIGTQNSTSDPPDGVHGQFENVAATHTFVNVGTTDSLTVKANDQIALWCDADEMGSASADDGSLTAIPVTSVTTGSPS